MRRLFSAALVLLAFVMLFQSITLIDGLAQSISLLPEEVAWFWANIAAVVLHTAAALVLAWLLISRRESISARLFPDDDAVTLGLGTQELLWVGLLIGGVWTVVTALPDTASAILYLITDRLQARELGVPVTGGLSITGSVLRLAGDLMTVVAGAALVWFARPLSVWLLAVPRGGGDSTQPPADPSAQQCPQCGHPYRESDYVDMAAARCEQCGTRLQPGQDF